MPSLLLAPQNAEDDDETIMPRISEVLACSIKCVEGKGHLTFCQCVYNCSLFSQLLFLFETQQLRDIGNAAFKAGDWEKAIMACTKSKPQDQDDEPEVDTRCDIKMRPPMHASSTLPLSYRGQPTNLPQQF
jgi:hypothetical protein